MTLPTKEVRFGVTVKVQEYAITLGCNPGGSVGGPPITIDWDILSCETISLKAYERARRPLMRISSQERTRMLTAQGFLEDALLQAERLAAEIRNSRIESSLDPEESSWDSFRFDDECTLDAFKHLEHHHHDVTTAPSRCADFEHFQRSAQGNKAMMMFQKRRIVR